MAGLVSLVLAAISIAAGVVAAKQAIKDGAEIESVLAARLLVAAPALALLLPLLARVRPRPAGVRPVAIALAAGALLWLAGRTEFEGLARMPAGMLVVLLSTSPLWVALIGWATSGRALARADVVALVVLTGGVAVMAAPIGEPLDAVGVLLGLLGAASFATFLVVLERNGGIASALSVPLGMIGAGVTLLILQPGAPGSLFGGIDTALALAIGASGAFYALFVGRGLGATDSVTTAIVVASEPVFAAILAYLLLGEGMSARGIVGGAIALAAVASVALRSARDDRPTFPVG